MRLPSRFRGVVYAASWADIRCLFLAAVLHLTNLLKLLAAAQSNNSAGAAVRAVTCAADLTSTDRAREPPLLQRLTGAGTCTVCRGAKGRVWHIAVPLQCR